MYMLDRLEELVGMFVKIFGKNPQTKILDFLADHPKYDYTISELAEKTGVSRPTLYRVLKNLMNANLVIITRRIGRSNLYQLNLKNKLVKCILRFDFEIAKIIADLEAEETVGSYEPLFKSAHPKTTVKP